MTAAEEMRVKLVREMPDGTFLFFKDGTYFRLTEGEAASLFELIEDLYMEQANALAE